MSNIIDVKGSHREIGRAIGESIPDDIGKALDMYFSENGMDDKVIHGENFRRLYGTAQENFPDFMEEMKGIAEASGHPLNRLMAFSFDEELAPGEHCLSYAARRGDGSIIFSHNEDWEYPLPLYIIRAKPDGKPAFLSVGYAGQMPGSCCGMNEEGVAFGGNSVDTKVNYGGLPKVYCSRSILEARDIGEAVSRITKRPRSVGNNSLIVSAKEGRMANFEWAHDEHDLIEGEKSIIHSNHFLSDKLKPHQLEPLEEDEKMKKMIYIQAKGGLEKLETPGPQDFMKLSRDYVQSQIQTYGKSYTLASVVSEPARGELYFCNGDPSKGSFILYRI